MQYYVIDAQNVPTLPKFTAAIEKLFKLSHPPRDLNSAPGENQEVNDLTFLLEEIMRGIESRDIRDAKLTIINSDALLKDSPDYSGKEFMEFLDGLVSNFGEDKFKYTKMTTEELSDAIANRVVKKNKDSVQNIAHYQLGVPFNDISATTKSEIQKMHPNVSSKTIERTLDRLQEEGKIESLGTGRSAKWMKKFKLQSGFEYDAVSFNFDDVMEKK